MSVLQRGTTSSGTERGLCILAVSSRCMHAVHHVQSSALHGANLHPCYYERRTQPRLVLLCTLVY
eukprot:7130-Heterococcus_DN1.PRE.1